MWGKFKTFFLSNLDIAAMDRPKLPGGPKLPRMTVGEGGHVKNFFLFFLVNIHACCR